ncbi:MAG: valine--tRNA ligase [Candidatus Nealsonbacteria bacterium RIFCSPLOWO2_02_39_8]|uniref:Valine--tRNA ligase n=1 Tax=Candidatus Nealsonbacteria bacterium RIFCSPLOWO2_02_39_8 TaxID=1801674 RepID=A0A1G2EJD8_9BACT|nr:MAG: valine--tRNA ligase [Candidatus Nealsonbacteria bacterium RIFCSPLOWO2_02_39_8]
METPTSYNPKEVEDKIYHLWTESGFFNPDKLPRRHKKPYSIAIPPPNITGELHMGHALNATVQDILIRRKRMQGFKTLWLPGADHAGIAAQNVVEKKLRKEGKTRFDLGKEKFIEEVWKWKNQYGKIILNQFKKIGSSCDWSRSRFTMDESYSQAVRETFAHYYKKGWIYRGEKIVNWCSRCGTSLSDLELEYKEEKSNLWFIKYPIAKNPKPQTPTTNQTPNLKPQIQNYITVATTRPETMLGDTAVAVNPKDERYKNLVGEKVILPLCNREITIVADRLVDSNFGTGAVKITPAHDLTDYQIALNHNLKSIKIINERGQIAQEAPLDYQGLKTLDARQRIVEDLKNSGLLEKTEECIHQIPRCYRCGSVVELIPSLQWFLKMEELANLAMKPVKNKKIKFHPKNFEKPYFDWLKNVKDWCISRQLWWGHKLPAWQCQTEKISNFQFPISNLKEGYFINLGKPEKCPICENCKPKQSNDVLDTWFSSALWPFATLGWPEKSKDLKTFYPTDILSTARDIINLWVGRMIFSGIEFTGKIPFKDVYIHPTVLTKDGRRMSKSLGTGINPIELINEFGADATRFGIAYQITGNQDVKFSQDNIFMGKKFCNKIWNASRFVCGQISISNLKFKNSKLKVKNLTIADKKILNQLDKTIRSVDKYIDNFEFGKAAHTIYDFFWHDFCDNYIETAKKQLALPSFSKKKLGGGHEKTKKILFFVLLNSLKIMHPFMPFITEEIYQNLPIENKKKCLTIEEWPK